MDGTDAQPAQAASLSQECLHSELSYKRLEAGRFIRDWASVSHREMDWTALKLMLEGIEPQRQAKRYRHGSAVPPTSPVTLP